MRILRAFVMAAWGHRRQRDKAGRRYLWHLVTVAWIAYGLTRDPEAVVVGLLHDYVEDIKPLGGVAVLRRHFGKPTAARLLLLTHNAGTTYIDYIQSVAIGNDRICLAVKMADLLHNLDGRRCAVRRPTGFFAELLPPMANAQGSPERAARYQSALGRLAEVWSTPP